MTHPKQQKDESALLPLIDAMVDDDGYPPSMRELAEKVGWSVSTVREALLRLERQGLIARHAGRPRAMRLTDQAQAVMKAPEVTM